MRPEEYLFDPVDESDQPDFEVEIIEEVHPDGSITEQRNLVVPLETGIVYDDSRSAYITAVIGVIGLAAAMAFLTRSQQPNDSVDQREKKPPVTRPTDLPSAIPATLRRSDLQTTSGDTFSSSPNAAESLSQSPIPQPTPPEGVIPIQ